ncbi:MAG: hypothetical protein KAY24_08640, partial [Candidatus Eisenbacteria sp.]|nr:hypothetical protein [Candidatus Eisenbacteria bacterium]
MKIRILLLGLLLTVSFLGLSQEPGPIWVLTIDGEIGRGTVSYLRQGLSEAEEAGARTVVIVFSTPGGYLDSAVASRDA